MIFYSKYYPDLKKYIKVSIEKELSDRHTFSKSHKRNIEPVKNTIQNYFSIRMLLKPFTTENQM